jgi:lambda repressor-like predicted transcriptional regulator
MNEEYECIHCGHIDSVKNHWKKCKDHPANKIIAELKEQIKSLESELKRERRSTKHLMEELNRRT